MLTKHRPVLLLTLFLCLCLALASGCSGTTDTLDPGDTDPVDHDPENGVPGEDEAADDPGDGDPDLDDEPLGPVNDEDEPEPGSAETVLFDCIALLLEHDDFFLFQDTETLDDQFMSDYGDKQFFIYRIAKEDDFVLIAEVGEPFSEYILRVTMHNIDGAWEVFESESITGDN